MRSWAALSALDLADEPFSDEGIRSCQGSNVVHGPPPKSPVRPWWALERPPGISPPPRQEPSGIREWPLACRKWATVAGATAGAHHRPPEPPPPGRFHRDAAHQ